MQISTKNLIRKYKSMQSAAKIGLAKINPRKNNLSPYYGIGQHQ